MKAEQIKKRCCESSGINWNEKICPECFNVMNFQKSNKKKRIRNIPEIGIITLRSLSEKYICDCCGYSELPETDRDKAIRLGLITI